MAAAPRAQQLDDLLRASKLTPATLAKIEVCAVDLSGVSAAKIRQLLQKLPADDVYHSNFVRHNTLYYLLSHGTLKSTINYYHEIAAINTEFARYTSKEPTEKGRSDSISNDAVVQTVSSFVDKINELQTFFKNNAALRSTIAAKRGDTDFRENAALSLVKFVVSEADKIVEHVKPLINCRAVAEVLANLHAELFHWLGNTIQYAPCSGDSALDATLKMKFFYEHYRDSNDGVPRKFLDHIRGAEKDIRLFTMEGVEGSQQPGAEYVEELSYNIFSRDLTANANTAFVFPTILTDTTVLRYMSVKNFFFHPGLVYTTLNPPDDAHGSVPYEDTLRGFLETVAYDLFLTDLKSAAPQRLYGLAERFRKLVDMGLNEKTSESYVQMFTRITNPARREIVHLVLLIIYNAYVFFTCLRRYSPTFIFYTAKQRLLDKQRSRMIHLQDDMQFVWDNVLINVKRSFHVWFSEEEFAALTRGLSSEDKSYVYKDIMDKWGDVLFASPCGKAATGHGQNETVSQEDVADACRSLLNSDGGASVETLLAMRTHANFTDVFLEHTAIPLFGDVISSYYGFQPEGEHKLLKLIYFCQLLVPEKIALHQNLISLYNLMCYVEDIDVNTFKSVRSLVSAIAAAIELPHEPARAAESQFVVELCIHSTANSIRDSVDRATKAIVSDNKRKLSEYAKHVRRCSSIAISEGKISADMQTVSIYVDRKLAVSLSTEAFENACQRLVQQGDALWRQIQHTDASLDRVCVDITRIVDDVEQLKLYDANHPLAKKLYTFVTKTTRKLKEIEAKFSSVTDACEKSNRLVSASLRRILRTINVLKTDAIKTNGAPSCIADATAAVRVSSAFTRVPNQNISREAAISSLNDVFGGYATSPVRIVQMSEEPIAPADYINIFGSRYDSPRDVQEFLRDWYVAFAPVAINDLLQPLSQMSS